MKYLLLNYDIVVVIMNIEQQWIFVCNCVYLYMVGLFDIYYVEVL